MVWRLSGIEEFMSEGQKTFLQLCGLNEIKITKYNEEQK